MNKQIVISLIVIILGVIGLVLWSKSVDRVAINADEFGGSHPAVLGAEAGKLTAEETLYNFGKISMRDGNVSKIFKVTNSGASDVKLTEVSTSCMCTAAYILRDDGSKLGPFGMPGHGDGKAGEIIPVGESRNIEVVYDPNAHGPAGVGLVDRFIYLEDENGQKLELEIKASVTP